MAIERRCQGRRVTALTGPDGSLAVPAEEGAGQQHTPADRAPVDVGAGVRDLIAEPTGVPQESDLSRDTTLGVLVCTDTSRLRIHTRNYASRVPSNAPLTCIDEQTPVAIHSSSCR